MRSRCGVESESTNQFLKLLWKSMKLKKENRNKSDRRCACSLVCWWTDISGYWLNVGTSVTNVHHVILFIKL